MIRFTLGAAAVVAIAACSNSATPGSGTPAVTAAGATGSVTSTASVAATQSAAAAVETNTPGFVLTSPNFAPGGTMVAKFTCNGVDASPALHWEGAPAATASFALIVEDPDAANFVHWVAYAIPGGTGGDLPLGVHESGPPSQAMNSFGTNTYRGPCPPSGTHHYTFTMYALAGQLSLEHASTATAGDVRAAMKGLILARTVLTATYGGN